MKGSPPTCSPTNTILPHTTLENGKGQTKHQKGSRRFHKSSIWCWYPPVPRIKTATHANTWFYQCGLHPESLAQEVIAVLGASDVDLNFLQDILTKDSRPEFHGRKTKESWEQGHPPQHKTKAIYLPLIGMKPSDSDTKFTGTKIVHDLTFKTGQTVSWHVTNNSIESLPRCRGINQKVSSIWLKFLLVRQMSLSQIGQSFYWLYIGQQMKQWKTSS